MAGEKIKVAVIGAGIAGLTAACRLRERGYEVAIFDERIYVGGNLGAHPHRITGDPRPQADPQKPATQGQIREWCKRLDAGTLPDDLWKEIGKHLERQSTTYLASRARDSSMKPKAKAAKRSTAKRKMVEGLPPAGDFAVQPEKDPYHADRGWVISNPQNRLRFNIWMHRDDRRKLRLEITDNVFHEHCYHMFLNWYHNFWQLMRDIGRERSQAFKPLNEVAHLFPGETSVGSRLRYLTSLGSVDSIGDNLLSGVASVPDMFLWFYALADLVSEPLQEGRYLDWASVHGFLRSRWHATEQSVMLNEYVLSKAFAIPTYLTSAFAYRSYVEFGNIEPDPMVWVPKGNSHRMLIAPLVEKLTKPDGGNMPCKLNFGRKVTALETAGQEAGQRIVGLKYRPSDMRDAAGDGFHVAGDDDDGEGAETAGPQQSHAFRPDYVILAVPPKALAELASPLRERLPSLNAVRKLQSGVTAALDLHFNRRLPGIPDRHVILRGSRYGLTLFDNSQVWTDDDNLDPAGKGQKGYCTCLSVAATDFYMIDGMRKKEAIAVIIEDLRRFIDFEDADIDYSKSYLQMNDTEPLFLNEVGSEPWRPGPRTEIDNLFVAGDFCNNDIGIVSVEGAVVSGLLAARCVQARAREDRKLLAGDPEMRHIPILSPQRPPRMNARFMKQVMTPLASVAKAWSRAEEFARHPERALSPREMQASVDDAAAAPGQVAADWLGLAGDAALWSAELPFRKKG